MTVNLASIGAAIRPAHFTVLFIGLMSAPKSIAAPGDIDLSFGGTGQVITAIGSSSRDRGSSVAVQVDGKVVVAGNTIDGTGQHIALVRYNPDGSLDTAFNGTGKVVTAYGSSNVAADSVAIQSDGKIVVAGQTYNGSNNDFALVRYNADGSLDTTFNGTGKVTTDIGNGQNNGNSVAIQSDGKIVVAGTTEGAADITIVRYRADGSLDTSFSGDGKLTTDFGGAPDYGYSVTTQSDGKIVVAGESNGYFALIRYNANGGPDNSFAASGWPNVGFNGPGYSVAVQSDGKILVAGSGSAAGTFALVRYSPNGNLDTSFSGDGIVTTEIDGNNQNFGRTLAIQSDGKLVVAGYSGKGLSNFDFVLIRYNANGSLDTTFNATGIVRTDLGSSNDFGYGVALQSDGSIVVAGYSDVAGKDTFAVVRYQGGLPAPQIAVEQPAGVNLLDGAANVAFGTVPPGSNTNRTFTIKNTGSSDLTGLTISKDGTDAADFTVISSPSTPVAGPSGTTTFMVRFAPTTPGQKTAAIHILSNDADQSPFDINLTGTGTTPEIAMQQPPGTDISDGSANPVNFGPVVARTIRSLTFIIRNQGTSDLSGLAVTKSAVGTPQDFTVAPLGATTVVPNALTSFTVTFSPAAAGRRTATLHIASNDADENPFDINLAGTLATASEAWRQTHFGSPYDTGTGADLNDADGDGIVNLLEFATASDPTTPTLSPGRLVKNGNTLEFTYTRRKAALSEMIFRREFSETLAGSWSTVGGTVETVLSDDGVLQQVKTTVPAGSNGKRFVRLRVTRL